MPSDAFRMTGESVSAPGTFSVLGPDGYYELFDTEDDANLAAALGNKLLDVTPEPVSGGVEVAAREALELAEEAMTYVSDYFREKWDMDARRDKIAAALASSPDPETANRSVVLEGWLDARMNDGGTIREVRLDGALIDVAIFEAVADPQTRKATGPVRLTIQSTQKGS